ncbi:nucleotidyltransferase domain protein [Streptococcus sp. oral taxon 056 str. F0418]|uniref:nucleotidyltransferase family protein n=1 Tax=Streptococcus sp. oral taxon 056 TaxID=712620 RepID=UPI00021805B2|nr:nucleotidyltransferase domain-containing protein [Streptococcus sp. oral taxon 056]EGP67366.1 nucleotidyltransferase domain protein [Streptococcus sp. oral taxon 056 str. F0418]
MIYTISDIQSKLSVIAYKYQISKVYLFGSYARGTADEMSDIDLAIDLTGSIVSGLMYFEMEEEIKALFNIPVDVLTVEEILTGKSYITQQLRVQFLKERIVIYENRAITERLLLS